MRSLIFFGLFCGLLSAQDASPKPLSVLILDGQNNHDGPRTTKALRATLDAAPGLSCKVVSTPRKGSEADAWSEFRPGLKDAQVLVLNYNGEAWPKAFQQEFLAWIEAGGGVVCVHASNNPFADWAEYDELIGLGWRGGNHGRRAVVDDATGRLLIQPEGEGIGAGHGRVHAFAVTTRAAEHPITAGFPRVWMHGRDELYHGQRGPARGMNLLLSAYSDPKTGGTGAHEPIAWWTQRGKGRFVTTVLGHVWEGQRHQDALDCVGFQTFLVRAVLWAGQREVPKTLPQNFPTKDAVSLKDPAQAKPAEGGQR